MGVKIVHNWVKRQKKWNKTYLTESLEILTVLAQSIFEKTSTTTKCNF